MAETQDEFDVLLALFSDAVPSDTDHAKQWSLPLAAQSESTSGQPSLERSSDTTCTEPQGLQTAGFTSPLLALALPAPTQASVPQQPEPASGRRKRAYIGKAHLQQLEDQIAQQTAALEQLSINNIYLTERVRMLELVIKVRDHQMERIQSLKQGLKFNPFEGMGMGPLGSACHEPAKMAQLFISNVTVLAEKLALLMPELQRYPYLLHGPDPDTPWPRAAVRVGPAGELATPLPEHLRPKSYNQQLKLCRSDTKGNSSSSLSASGSGVTAENGLSAPQPLSDTLDSVEDLRKQTEGILVGVQFKKLVAPDLPLAISFNALHALDSQHKDWNALAKSVIDRVETQGPDVPGVAPPVAPDHHWAQVSHSLGLTSYQKLQAGVLNDIYMHYSQAVTAQRMQVVATLQRLQQQQEERCAGQPGMTCLIQKPWEVVQEEESCNTKLQHSIIKERLLTSLVSEAMLVHILSPVQAAIAAANSYPYFPDQLALMKAAAQMLDVNTLKG